MLTGVAHAAVCVSDVDEATRWYSEVLGLRVLSPPCEMSGDAIERDMGELVPSPVVVKAAIVGFGADDHVLELIEYPEVELSPDQQARPDIIHRGLTHVGLVCDDVESTRVELERKGVAFLTSGTADVAGLRTTWFHDPWGTVFILVEKRIDYRPYWGQHGIGASTGPDEFGAEATPARRIGVARVGRSAEPTPRSTRREAPSTMKPGSRGEAHTAVVEHYLERLVAHDWPAVSECLVDDVVRVGPFGDTFTGRESYVSFLSGLMPSLPGYAMRVDRVVSAGTVGDSGDGHKGATVLVELTETVEMDGAPVDTAEALVFDVDGDFQIAHIAIYIQRT